MPRVSQGTPPGGRERETAPKCQGLLSWRGLQSGRNQDPVGALLRSRRPPCRWALACLRSRCLRAKAAEKELQTTKPLTTHFLVTAKVEGTRRAPFKSRLRWLGRLRLCLVAIVIRVGRSMSVIAPNGAQSMEGRD